MRSGSGDAAPFVVKSALRMSEVWKLNAIKSRWLLLSYAGPDFGFVQAFQFILEGSLRAGFYDASEEWFFFATCNRLNQLLTRLVDRNSEDKLYLRISPHISILDLSFILVLQVCIGYFSPICYQTDSKKYGLSLFPCFFFFFAMEPVPKVLEYLQWGFYPLEF